MACLPGDYPFAHARSGSGGCMARPERVPREVLRVEASSRNMPFHHEGHRLSRKAAFQDLAVPIHGTEERAAHKPSRLNPCPHSTHRAGRWIAAIGDPNPPALTTLVCLGSAKGDHQPLDRHFDVFVIQAHEFAPSEGPCESQ